jgi:hypothetical protein
MSLRKCKECGNEVSTTAESCPKCGAVLKNITGGCMGCLGAIVCLIIIFAVIGSLTNSGSNPVSSPVLPYEELGKVGMQIMIFTPNRDRSIVEKIADVYAKRYATSYTYLYFFDNLDHAKRYLAIRLADSEDESASTLLSSGTPNEVDVWMDSIFAMCRIEKGSWKIEEFDEKPVGRQ